MLTSLNSWLRKTQVQLALSFSSYFIFIWRQWLQIKLFLKNSILKEYYSSFSLVMVASFTPKYIRRHDTRKDIKTSTYRHISHICFLWYKGRNIKGEKLSSKPYNFQLWPCNFNVHLFMILDPLLQCESSVTNWHIFYFRVIEGFILTYRVT